MSRISLSYRRGEGDRRMRPAVLLRRLVVLVEIGLLWAALSVSQAAAPLQPFQAPGFYRMMLGSFEITALLDGTHAFPVDEVMTNVPRNRAHALLKRADLAAPVEGSINAFLVNTGSRLILIDSGAGALYGTDGGHLVGNLRASGYQPEQVDDIYLTHLHRDHVGGLNDKGRAVFSNARVHVNRVDADYWLDRDTQARAPAFLGSMFDGAIESLQPYRDLGHFSPFDIGDGLGPDIHALRTVGHTPGHTSYVVESGGERLVIWGDIVHVEPIQFPDPAASVKYDSLPAAARRQRALLFAELASKGYWVAAAHVSFPGLGHVRKQGGSYVWIPANYTTAFTKH